MTTRCVQRSWRAGLAVALAMLLGACASPPVLDGSARDAAWEAHHARLRQLSTWRTTGKVAVTLPEDSWSANLRWRQRDEAYRIWLGGPFGQGAVNIEGDLTSVSLRTAEGRRVTAGSPELLMASELGVEVPISMLRYWIVGRPAPGAPVARLDLDGQGRLAGLEQAGWQVSYPQYQDSDAGTMPSRLEISRGDVRARFVLGDWQRGA